MITLSIAGTVTNSYWSGCNVDSTGARLFVRGAAACARSIDSARKGGKSPAVPLWLGRDAGGVSWGWLGAGSSESMQGVRGWFRFVTGLGRNRRLRTAWRRGNAQPAFLQGLRRSVVTDVASSTKSTI